MDRIRRQLRKLAFGKPNDRGKPAVWEHADIEKLDLSMLTEIKRSDKGTVEIKLADRTRALDQLAQLAGDNEDKAAAFLQALLKGMENNGT